MNLVLGIIGDGCNFRFQPSQRQENICQLCMITGSLGIDALDNPPFQYIFPVTSRGKLVALGGG